MGLDMYLYCNSKRVCQEINDQEDDWERNFQTPRGIAVYWRKANAIHNWLVTNIQDGEDDCKTYEVSIDDLVRLHDTCKKVLESTKLVEATIENGQKCIDGKWVPVKTRGQKLEDPTVANELLPTHSGFFFGSTEYDQWYWWDVHYTEYKLAKLLDMLKPKDNEPWNSIHPEEPDWIVRFYYRSSW